MKSAAWTDLMHKVSAGLWASSSLWWLQHANMRPERKLATLHSCSTSVKRTEVCAGHYAGCAALLIKGVSVPLLSLLLSSVRVDLYLGVSDEKCDGVAGGPAVSWWSRKVGAAAACVWSRSKWTISPGGRSERREHEVESLSVLQSELFRDQLFCHTHCKAHHHLCVFVHVYDNIISVSGLLCPSTQSLHPTTSSTWNLDFLIHLHILNPNCL